MQKISVTSKKLSWVPHPSIPPPGPWPQLIGLLSLCFGPSRISCKWNQTACTLCAWLLSLLLMSLGFLYIVALLTVSFFSLPSCVLPSSALTSPVGRFSFCAEPPLKQVQKPYAFPSRFTPCDGETISAIPPSLFIFRLDCCGVEMPVSDLRAGGRGGRGEQIGACKDTAGGPRSRQGCCPGCSSPCGLQPEILGPSLIGFLLPPVGGVRPLCWAIEKFPEDDFVHGVGRRSLQQEARILLHRCLLSTYYKSGVMLPEDVMAVKNVTVLVVRAVMMVGEWGG